MSGCEEFYRLRDRRSEEYLGRPIGDLAPAHIAIDSVAASTSSGQLALLALANQAARTARRISFSLPKRDVPVLARTPFPGRTVSEVLLATVNAIDPCGEFTLSETAPEGSVSIGIGINVGADLDWYLGADRAVALLRRSPIGFTDWEGTMRGAALASSLGASAVLRQQIGLAVAPRSLSAWNYAEDDRAEFGPSSLDPVDVGRVLMVGAGAVGASAAYWLHAFGVNGEGWAVVDGDQVELHNTNRGLVFLPFDAGWPNGTAVNKALLVAPLITGAKPHGHWYHESHELRNQTFDLVLALANDHAVREVLTTLSAAVSLQATTGENWLSQLHRHVLGRDGCIWCRTGEVKTPKFGCSTAVVEKRDGTRSDAALPFLSAASGLMVATALQRLSMGDLMRTEENCWSWDFGSEHRMTATPVARCCRDSCALVPSATVRRRIVAGTRWAGLVD
jgi:hypothetical protein